MTYRRNSRTDFSLDFIAEKGVPYGSHSQKARVLTEDWVNRQIYCPACGFSVKKVNNNAPVLDFDCSNCREQFELKSKRKKIAFKVVDGAYQKMMERLNSNNQPNLFLLSYHPINLAVLDFLVIPKHFFIPQIIERRKPLSATARRAGWTGCNILLQSIPQSGKIFIVKEGVVELKSTVLENWKRTLFLREEKEIKTKGWILDIMACIDQLGKKEFSLQELYAFEKDLVLKHPENRHIKDKIRQQLQFLRDRRYLEFLGGGRYQVL